MKRSFGHHANVVISSLDALFAFHTMLLKRINPLVREGALHEEERK
jgi:hypothetical protein